MNPAIKNLVFEGESYFSGLIPEARLLPGRLRELAQDQLAALLANPELARVASFALREVRPIAIVRGFGLATRFADVVEILENPAYFRATEIDARAMERTTGAFILGTNDERVHEREAKFLRSAVHPGDSERIRNLAQATAEQLLQAATSEGRIDAASGYAHAIALTLVADYFGVRGPDQPTLARWTRAIFRELSLNVTRRSSVTEQGLRAAAELNLYLERQVRELRLEQARGTQLPDHVLARLVRAQVEFNEAPLRRNVGAVPPMDDEMVQRNIAGIIVVAIDTLATAIVHALDQLLQRPAELARARAAAVAGDDALVSVYAFEALRFNPHIPVIVRECARDFRLARGTERETLIPAGTTLYASTISAMFDASVLEAPGEFRIDRPWEHYLHFGRGMHRCFGERFSRVVMPQAIKALLLRPEMRRARGVQGRIAYQGPFPSRMMLSL